MARPAKLASTTRKHLTKEEKENRLAVENKFKVDGEVVAPDYFNAEQIEVFVFLVDALKSADVLSTLDTFLIEQTAVNAVMLKTSNKLVTDKPELAGVAQFVNSNEKLVRTFLRLADSLCLSPASRAKLGSLVANNKKEAADPLINILSGGNND